MVRTGPTANALAVTYATRGTATNGSDYTSLSGTVTIPAGQSTAYITVTPLADGVREPNETVVVELQDRNGYNVGLTSERTATVIIQDDSDAPTGGASLWSGTALSNFTGFGGTFTELTDPVRGAVIQAQVTTARPESPWDSQLLQAINRSVSNGDILFLEFWARSIGSGPAAITAVFERVNSPWDKSLVRHINVNRAWTRVQLPFRAHDNFGSGQARFGFHLGHYAQTIQFAGFRTLNYGQGSVDLAPGGPLSLYNIDGTMAT